MPALKYSRQREAIKCFLMTRKDHPTADVVYHSLRADGKCRLSAAKDRELSDHEI